ncbi:ZIP family metal transporter [Mycoplasmopsis cynos]|uniref:ZIP family metal transporter n=1 Tax=Mycoplasmopsis cynos TaxID=171284 RepID=UPI0021FC4EE1|nr:ZIP family metal transporter [Mycoplasmopsis cynos]UWV92450.1 ZIP family metal transporter [Mycoplasmopsis cynos]
MGSIINDAGKAIMFAAIGGIFIFTALVEFFPEIYHINFDKKKWIFTLIVLFLGILVAAFILSFHHTLIFTLSGFFYSFRKKAKWYN